MLKTILVVEDDNDINRMVTKLLSGEGYLVKNAFSGTEALLIHDASVDLILLDLMLPGKSGDEIISLLLEKHHVPVIVMSAIDRVGKKVELFKNGAVDYITKPFHNDELLARISLRLKEVTCAGEAESLSYKDLVIDPEAYSATCSGKEVLFTKKEFELLRLFMENPTKTFTKTALFDRIWGYDSLADNNTLNAHISKIKSKLKECNPEEEYIETIWSVGYRLKKQN